MFDTGKRSVHSGGPAADGGPVPGRPEWMDRLEACLTEAAAEDMGDLSDQALSEGFARLARASDMATAQRLRRLSEIDRRKTFRDDGHPSATSWLVAEFQVAGGEAAGAVRMARALQDMPATAQALATGVLTTSAVKVLVEAKQAAPEAFSRAEPDLVNVARDHPVAGLARVAAEWRTRVADGLQAWERLRQARRLKVCPGPSGMVRVDGELDPETGEAVMTAVRSVMDAEATAGGGSDERTGPQRRADALGEVCRSYLDRTDRPSVGAERPHVTVTVDLQVLQGLDPGFRQGSSRAEFDHGGPIHPEAARRLACDASVTRVITAVLASGRSEPLDVGRRTPVVPAALRRAVVARDRSCRFPGCDRPPGWCQCHHVTHWARGGRTALANLVLLCRHHHTRVHEGGFSVAIADAHLVFRRPDGTVIEGRAPPVLALPP